MINDPTDTISVIITCYNHAQYLTCAIDSVRMQEYNNCEIVVVDDGSTDLTAFVARSYKDVKYVGQANQGLAAARNTGIRSSSGNYLIFLDADDWLYAGALECQVRLIRQYHDCMAVAGGHDKVNDKGEVIGEDENIPVHRDHYMNLLEGNFIGMHGAVMYKRSVFDKLSFDTNLPAAEDYDLYLRLTRDHSIFVHQTKVAAYRIHSNNMSRNVPLMLHHVSEVLKTQRHNLRSPREEEALQTGLKNWNEYYTEVLIANKLSATKSGQHLKHALTRDELTILKANAPGIIPKIRVLNLKNRIKQALKNWLVPAPGIAGVQEQYPWIPIGKINWGSFIRTQPLSKNFGFDRGGAIDRYYIEKFLHENEELIRDTVLEIGDNTYTEKFGKDKVQLSECLHITADHPATYSGDLSRADEIPIPGDRFDCIILTQTLHFIYDYNRAIQQCFRILKPGGTLLLTVPGVSQIDAGEGQEYWLWSFSKKAMLRIMRENFPSPDVAIQTYGNVFSASAFLWGAGLAEIPRKEFLDAPDPGYQVVITVKAVKLPAANKRVHKLMQPDV